MKITITPSKRKKELRVTFFEEGNAKPKFPTSFEGSFEIDTTEDKIKKINLYSLPEGDVLIINSKGNELMDEIYISDKYPNKTKPSKICGHLNNEDKCIAYGPAMDCAYFDKQEDCDAFEEVEWIEDEEESEDLD